MVGAIRWMRDQGGQRNPEARFPLRRYVVCCAATSTASVRPFYCVGMFAQKSHLWSAANCRSVIVPDTGRVSERYSPGLASAGLKTGHFGAPGPFGSPLRAKFVQALTR